MILHPTEEVIAGTARGRAAPAAAPSVRVETIHGLRARLGVGARSVEHEIDLPDNTIEIRYCRWKALGTWGVPVINTFPAVGGASPTIGSETTQTFTFTFVDSRTSVELRACGVRACKIRGRKSRLSGNWPEVP